MRSLILIPAYLLRNTLHRWLENPASPATKFLIPFLLAALGLVLFGLLQEVEKRLQDQLDRADLRMVITEETLFADAAAARLATGGLNESTLWEPWLESYAAFQQAPLLAASGSQRQIPVLTYQTPPDFLKIPETAPGEPRAILLLSKNASGLEQNLSVMQYDLPAVTAPLPDLFARQYQAEAIALFPAEYLEEVLGRGFTQFQVMQPKPGVSPAELEKVVRAHAFAENRNLRVRSSLEVLKGLDDLLRQQKLARVAVAGVIAVVLSLTLGSLSLLEFRQESYLLALLRSFGVRRVNLVLHYLFETSLLTFGGLAAAVAFYHFLPELLVQVSGAPISAIPFSFNAPGPNDLIALGLAAGVGVIISAFPVIFGLRPPPGLLLP